MKRVQITSRSKLFRLVRKGKSNKLARLLKTTVVDTSPDVNGFTALHHALHDYHTMEVLLAAGMFAVNASASYGVSPLNYAINHKSDLDVGACVALVRDPSFDTQKNRRFDVPILHQVLCLEQYHPGLVQPLVVELLAKGDIDVNEFVETHVHSTALHAAARYCNVDVLRLIIRHGGNLDTEAYLGTALVSAVEGSLIENVRELLKFRCRGLSKAHATANSDLWYYNGVSRQAMEEIECYAAVRIQRWIRRIRKMQRERMIARVVFDHWWLRPGGVGARKCVANLRALAV